MFRLTDPERKRYMLYRDRQPLGVIRPLPIDRDAEVEGEYGYDDPFVSGDPCDDTSLDYLDPQSRSVITPDAFGFCFPCELAAMNNSTASSNNLSADCELRGIATVLNTISEQPDQGGMQYMFDRDAFNEALETDYRVLHVDELHVLGRRSAGSASMWVDNSAVFFSCTPPATSWFADLRESISRGDVTHASVVLNRADYSIENKMGERVRVIHNVNLHSVRVMGFGRTPGVTIINKASRVRLSTSLGPL